MPSIYFLDYFFLQNSETKMTASILREVITQKVKKRKRNVKRKKKKYRAKTKTNLGR